MCLRSRCRNRKYCFRINLKTIDGGTTWACIPYKLCVEQLFYWRFTGWYWAIQHSYKNDGSVTWTSDVWVGAGYNDIYFADLNTGLFAGKMRF
jgi:hypothetical protein